MSLPRLDALSQLSIRKPRLTLALLAAVALAAAPGLARLEVRTDGRALVPGNDPAVRLDASVRQHFGVRDPLVVLIETSHPRGVWNPATMRHLKRLSDALAAAPGIGPQHVVSLATERRDSVYPGTLVFRPFLDPLPDTPALMSVLEQDVAAARIMTGTLVSADARAVSILVGVPALDPGAPRQAPAVDRAAIYERVRAVAERLPVPGDRVLVAGAPAAESLLGKYLLADLRLLVPLAMAVITLVFWRGCRRAWGTAAALVKIAVTLVWTFGLMGWLGFPVYLTTAVLPVILVSICLADEIHIFMQYQRFLGEPGGGGEPPAAVRATMRMLALPITLACLATAIGFLSFLASPQPAVRAFGIFAGLGTTFELLWSLTAIPATLTLLGPARMRRPRPFAPVGAGLFRRLAAPLLRYRLATLAVLALATAALGLGARRLYVQDSWEGGFAAGSPFRLATAEVNRELLGTHVLLARLRFDPPPAAIPDVGDRPARSVPTGDDRSRDRRGPLLDPAALRAIGAFEDFARARPEVGGVLGPYGQLSATYFLWMARREGTPEIPAEPRRIARLLDVFEQARGRQQRREIVDDDLRQALVSIFLKEANYRDTARLMRALRGYARRELEPRGTSLDFAGDVAVSQAMIPAIVYTQVASTSLALLGSCVLLCLLFRSVRLGLLALLPSSLAVLWVLGAMGWWHMPLGVATSMFAAITLGIGEDYAIHFLYRVRRAREDGRPDAVAHAFELAGPGIVSDTLTIALGFSVLVASRVPANARLGMVMAVALLGCCTLTLVGLGAALSAREPVTVLARAAA
jgi:predicted RND superfamily exporter protein